MASTPEAKVKKKVTEQLKKMGAYYFYAFTGGYGSSGVPDIVGCYRGYFFAIECKAGKNKPTALQEKQLREIVKAGGEAIVINEENVDEVTAWLLRLEESAKA
jgi:Holliday junction resolvase